MHDENRNNGIGNGLLAHMPRTVRKLDYIPEIMYDTPAYPGQKVSPVPFMVIPKDKDMPIGLFVLEYRQTGEYEVGDDGKASEIEEGPFPHTYIEMDYLVEVLREQFPALDINMAVRQIRTALGMKPTREESRAAGEQLLQKVQDTELVLEAKLKAEQAERLAKLQHSLNSQSPKPPTTTAKKKTSKGKR